MTDPIDDKKARADGLRRTLRERRGDNSTSSDRPLSDITRIVSSISHKFTKFFQRVTFEDLRQEGWVLAIQASDSFDPTRGMKLSTWIYTNVRQGLIQYACKGKTFASLDTETSTIEPVSSAPSPVQRVEAVDLVANLEVMLSPMAAEALVYMTKNLPKRMTISEMAGRMQLSSETIALLRDEIRRAAKVIKKGVECLWEGSYPDASDAISLSMQQNAGSVITPNTVEHIVTSLTRGVTLSSNDSLSVVCLETG